MCDERELELLREVRRRADALDVTYVHLRKGLEVSGGADYVLVTVDSYDALREAIGYDLEGYEAERATGAA
jgi:transposase-like protein